MEIVNKRVAETKDSTLGVLFVDNKPFGFVIEDEQREVKIKGETRILAGKYKLAIKKEKTPLTLKYQKKYDWFKYHIELLDVPNFSSIYIHIGNFEYDTDGCQIIGEQAYIAKGNFANKYSTKCFKRFYELVYPLLEKEEEIYYEII